MNFTDDIVTSVTAALKGYKGVDWIYLVLITRSCQINEQCDALFVFCSYSSLFLIKLHNDRPAGVEICASCIVPIVNCVSEIFIKNNCGNYSFQMIKARKST